MANSFYLVATVSSASYKASYKGFTSLKILLNSTIETDHKHNLEAAKFYLIIAFSL